MGGGRDHTRRGARALPRRDPSPYASHRRRLQPRQPLRTENADEAHAIDERIAAAWASHPRRYEITPASDFLTKAAQAIAALRDEVPPCCRHHFDKPL